MYVLAGPNGAGKSTLYETRLRPLHPGVEFVNADRLAHAALGRHATTLADAQLGQKLADDRRDALMAQGKSFITESTFSHESKLELIRQAKAAGYRVQLYHVNVRSADISVGRVGNRVQHGGHDVPEQKIRERYERNQPLIRQAALASDRAYVFDNSLKDKPPRLVVGMEQGQVRMLGDNVPAWAVRLYAQELQRFPAERMEPLAASFAIAQQRAAAMLGDGATTRVARDGGTYRGPVIAQTLHHTVQQVSPSDAVAHLTQRLARRPEPGQQVAIAYPPARGQASVTGLDRGEAGDRAREQARALRELPREQALREQPSLKTAYGLVDAALQAIPKANETTRTRVAAAMRDQLASYIERGERLPQPARPQGRANDASDKAAVAERTRAPEKATASGRSRAPAKERER